MKSETFLKKKKELRLTKEFEKQPMILFVNVVMKTETEVVADFQGGTEVNLVSAIRFYSRFCSLESWY